MLDQESDKDGFDEIKMRHRYLSFFDAPMLSSRLFLLQEERSSGQQDRSRGFWEERLIGQLDHQGASQPRGLS